MKLGFSTKILRATLALWAMYGASAQAQQLRDISPNPSAAEKKAFLAYMFREWDFLKVSKPACAPLLDDMKQGNVTFLDPDAYGETEKPQAVRDIEKRCPNLHLGMSWEYPRDVQDPDTRANVPSIAADDLTKMYGEPYRATRNFSLFNVRFPNSLDARPIFVAEKSCKGECTGDTGYTYYELIDPQRCVKERIDAMDRFFGEKQQLLPGAMFSPVLVGGKPYFVKVNRGMIRIEIYDIPRDVKPSRYRSSELYCTFDASNPHR